MVESVAAIADDDHEDGDDDGDIDVDGDGDGREEVAGDEIDRLAGQDDTGEMEH